MKCNIERVQHKEIVTLKNQHEKSATRKKCNMKRVHNEKSAIRGKCIMEKNEARKECNTEEVQNENSAT